MRRGTTPTHTFTLPFDCSEITKLHIAYAQDDEVLVEKTLSDCECDGNVLTVTLAEEETLLFDCKKRCAEIQLRVARGVKKLASDIFKVPIDRILKEGCLE